MQDEQKKLVIVGVLFVVMLGVGAFQFRSMGAVASNPVASPVRSAASPALQRAEDAPPQISVPAELPERDPFESPVVSSEPVPAQVNMGGSHHPGSNLGGGIGTPSPMPGEILPMTVEGGPTEHFPGVKPPPPEPQFQYRLSGVMLGVKPLATFVDSAGAQRLVAEGASIDPDSQLISVTPNGVMVNFRGKKLRIDLVGDLRAK